VGFKVILTPKSQDDLREIVAFIAEKTPNGPGVLATS